MGFISNGIMDRAIKSVEMESKSLVEKLNELLSPYDYDSVELSVQLPTVHLFEQFVENDIDIKALIFLSFFKGFFGIFFVFNF